MISAEQDLIARAARGDEAAFSTLALQYRDRLLRFLWLRCGSQSDAEDATQEALLNAWRYLPSYSEKWQFSTWLYRIGLRQLSKRPASAEPMIDEPASKETSEFSLEMRNVWRSAQKHLSKDANTALWLRYAEDASIKEIADIMDKSIVWVKVGLMRSRQRLARELSDGGQHERY